MHLLPGRLNNRAARGAAARRRRNDRYGAVKPSLFSAQTDPASRKPSLFSVHERIDFSSQKKSIDFFQFYDAFTPQNEHF
jgi:hypothetical protein